VSTQERNQKFPTFWQAILVIVALFLLEVFISIVLQAAGIELTSGDPHGSLITVLACGAAFSGLLAYKNIGYRDLFSPSGLPTGTAVGSLLLPLAAFSLGIFILSWEFSNLAAYAIPVSEEMLVSVKEMLSGGVISLIALCIIAPFVEEMLFRGIFLRSFLKNYSPWQAIFLSSLIFGLPHFYAHHIVIAATLGVALGWLYYTTRSLWPSIIAHAIQNGGSLLYVTMVPASLAEMDPVEFPATSLPALFTGVVALSYGVQQLRSISGRIHRNAGVTLAE
jgi:membrane protease YdiL (CAAX protease family)